MYICIYCNFRRKDCKRCKAAKPVNEQQYNDGEQYNGIAQYNDGQYNDGQYNEEQYNDGQGSEL